MNPNNIAAKVGVQEEIGLCVIEEQANYPKVGEKPPFLNLPCGVVTGYNDR